MDIKASVKYVKMSPRKVRLVVGLVRGLEVNKAIAQLKFLNKKATEPVLKLVNSAIANAEHNYELDKNNLFIKEIRVDESLTIKRWMPRAHGRATPIRKKMSHINLILGEIKDSGVVEAKKREVEKPINLEEVVKKSKTKGKEVKGEALKEDNAFEDDRKGGKKGFVNKIFQRKSG